LRLPHQYLRPLGPRRELRRLGHDGFEPGELGPYRVVALGVVAARAGAELGLEVPSAPLRRRPLLRGARQLLRLGAQLTGSLACPAALVPPGVPLDLGRGHHRGWLGQLLQPLAEEPAVVHDRLQLPVEDTEHRTVLGTERPTARGALALGAEQLDLVPLLLQIVVLAEQLRPAGCCVFLLPHPHRALLLRGALRRLEPLRQRQHLALRVGERCGGGPERVDATVQGGRRATQLLELRLVGAPRPPCAPRRAARSRAGPPRVRAARSRARCAVRARAPGRVAAGRTRARATGKPPGPSCPGSPSPPALSAR